MGSQEMGFAKQREDGEERLRAADFVLEVFEGVRQRVTDGPAQLAQAEGVEEGPHLMAHAGRAVLEVAVIEAQPRVEEDALHAEARRLVNLPREIVPHARHHVVLEGEIPDGADVLALDVTEDHGGVPLGDEAEKVARPRRARQVENARAGVVDWIAALRTRGVQFQKTLDTYYDALAQRLPPRRAPGR